MTASKAKGTAFEGLIVAGFAPAVPGVERRALAGGNDKGDLFLPGETRFIVEAKNAKRMDLAGWHAEAIREAANANVPGAWVAHKRRGKGQPLDQWVTGTVRDFLRLAYGWTE